MMLRNILCSTTLVAGVAVAQAMPHGPALAALALLTPAPGAHDRALTKVYRAAAHLLLGSTDVALGEFRAAVDQGFRSIMFARVVRFEEFDLFTPLLERPEFRAMLSEIKADNRRMLELPSTAGHKYGHVSKRAASALAALRSLGHSYGYFSVARLASAAHHATLRNRTYDQQY